VIDVADRADIDVGFGSIEFFFGHFRVSFFSIGVSTTD
jgi:hypothetical protein